MPDDVAAAIAVLLGVAALCALSVAVPQAVLCFRLWRHGQSIVLWTFKTMLWTGTLGLAMGWRFLTWLDFVLFDQEYLGPISKRWPIEAMLAVLVAGACFYAAALYHWTVTLESWRQRGTR